MTIRRYFQRILWLPLFLPLALYGIQRALDLQLPSLFARGVGILMLAGIGTLYILPIGYMYVAVALLGAWWLEARERRHRVVTQSA